jgi:dihydrodipicolinate synthase/N-acetylneuraminate lyase
MISTNDLKKKLHGIGFVNVTPFKENGEVDYDGYRENLRWTLAKIKGCPCTITP